VKFSLRFPRGVIDENETSLNAAKRELLEETGFKAKKLIRLSGEYYPNPTVMEEKWSVFVATDLSEVKGYEKDSYEDWGVVSLSVEEVEQKIRKNEIFDASAIIAFYMYKLMSSSY
jgi:ADP-ribose pyrophosphatase